MKWLLCLGLLPLLPVVGMCGYQIPSEDLDIKVLDVTKRVTEDTSGMEHWELTVLAEQA